DTPHRRPHGAPPGGRTRQAGDPERACPRLPEAIWEWSASWDASGSPDRQPEAPGVASASYDDLGALIVEAEAHLAHPRSDHGVAQPGLVLGMEQQEAAAASAD